MTVLSVFATITTRTKVWTANYLPFGGVHVMTGAPIDLRFPGQWFQLEAGLHQNWMRDYDPTLGRYIEADPLGLVDGASVYGYALQNPGRWTDPRGECVGPAAALLPVCIGVAWMIYDYLSDDCYTWGDFLYSAVSNFLPIRPLRPLLKAVGHGGGGGGSGGNGFSDSPGNTPPFRGPPCTTTRCGTQSREYGPDGYPKTDRDLPHPDEKGFGSQDHSHDWGRPSDGGPPTHIDRGLPRPPTAGDPPLPRGPNVPPP